MVDIEVARRIQHFATRLIRIARTANKGHPISSTQYSVMALLSAHPQMPVVELARRESVAHPTMSRMVSGMEKAELICRIKHPSDNRSSLISLTEKGERVYQEIAERRVMLFQMLLTRLSPAAVQEILDLTEQGAEQMESILHNMQHQDT